MTSAWSCRRAGAATARRTTSSTRTPPRGKREVDAVKARSSTTASSASTRSCRTTHLLPSKLRGRNERIDEPFPDSESPGSGVPESQFAWESE